jgi:hypothetical protein
VIDRSGRYALPSKLPRKFATIGISVGLSCAVLYWYDYMHNPFHLPTSDQAPPSYSAPPLYHFLEKMVLTLCPGLFLQIFTVHTGELFILAVWALAVLANGPLYYCVGLVVAALLNGPSVRRK